MAAQRSPRPHVCSELTSLPASPQFSQPVHNGNSGKHYKRHTGKFQEKFNSYIYRFFFKARKYHYDNLLPSGTKPQTSIWARSCLINTSKDVQAVIRKCSDWQNREEEITHLPALKYFPADKRALEMFFLFKKNTTLELPAATTVPPVPSQLMSWESTGRCVEVHGPVSPSSALNHRDTVNTWHGIIES